MAQTSDDFPSLSALLREGLGDLLAPGAGTLLDMVADDISFEFPFALPDGIERLTGKAELAAYLPNVGALFTVEALILDRAIRSADGRQAVLEFTGRAYANVTGARYDQDYVSVLDLKDGLITRYRDYWNPLTVLNATGGAEAVNAVLRSGNGGS